MYYVDWEESDEVDQYGNNMPVYMVYTMEGVEISQRQDGKKIVFTTPFQNVAQDFCTLMNLGRSMNQGTMGL